jgi:hypothetical protein
VIVEVVRLTSAYSLSEFSNEERQDDVPPLAASSDMSVVVAKVNCF